MVLLVMLLFFGIAIALGADGCFEKGTYQPTMTFNIVAVVSSIISALAGGFVCGKIARSKIPVWVMATLALLGGIGGIIQNFSTPEPGPRAPEVQMADIFKDRKGKEPVWFVFANTFIGFAGVLAGASLAKSKKH